MQFKARRELKRTRIEIIPMIDTMFFLLVFFMLSSLALTKLNGLPVNLPQAGSAAKQPPAELTITIDRAQKIYVNKTPVTFQTLQSVLVEKAGGPKANLAAATVIINADASVPHGEVVRCIDGAREVGITKFAIATAPESDDASAATQQNTNFSGQTGTFEGEVETVDSEVGTREGEVGTFDRHFARRDRQVGTFDSQFGTVDSQFGTCDRQVGTCDSEVGTCEGQVAATTGRGATRATRWAKGGASAPVGARL